MSLHLFGTVLTTRAVAANNRGENEGSATTLQKIIRGGDLYSTVGGEAIRYALRELWLDDTQLQSNRYFSDEKKRLQFRDPQFSKGWEKYIDNDVLGYMHARKETVSRRGALEIGRAVSTTPWPGTISTNFASPGSHPRDNKDPIPYQAEIHDTRYQYTFAMTPGSLRNAGALRTEKTLRAIQNLRRVGGNHARFLYDFSPEAIVLRITNDPAPRIMFCFDENERGGLSLAKLLARMEEEEKDVEPSEVVVGTVLPDIDKTKELRELGVDLRSGIKAAVTAAIARVKVALA